MPTESPPSPSKGIAASPSIFSYQTRILERTSSPRKGTGGPSLLSSPGKSALYGQPGSPPSTPIRRNVKQMLAGFEENAGRKDATIGLGFGGNENSTKDSPSAAAASLRADIGNKRNTTNFDFGPPSPAAGTPARPASMAGAMPSQSSAVTPGRTQAVEDTLAHARANALKRLEARRKQQGGSGPIDTPKDEIAMSDVASPVTPQTSVSPTKPSPFSAIFTPPSEELTPSKPSTSTYNVPTTNPSISRASQLPMSSPAKGRYVPSGLSASSATPSSSSSSKDKYGSVSSSDRRRLGRHLPRIASGDGPELSGLSKARSRQPSTLGRDSVVLPSSLGDTSASPPSNKTQEVLQPSTSENLLPSTGSTTTPGSKRRSYLPKGNLVTSTSGGIRPRAEVAGDEMKGLMSAVGGLPAKGTANDEGEGVTGELMGPARSISNTIRHGKSSAFVTSGTAAFCILEQACARSSPLPPPAADELDGQATALDCGIRVSVSRR